LSYHKIRGLVEVKFSEPPNFSGRAKRGTKGQGVRYEARVAEGFPEATSGQWIKFLDATGWHYCQPDLFFLTPRNVVILEVKRTDCGLARGQILNLYGPVLERLFQRSSRGIVVAKYLARNTDTKLLATSLPQALALTKLGIPTLHWLGRGEFPKD
jgi:hypothetical protein